MVVDKRFRVLIVAAHPDDEALGCAGTICRHVAEGDRVTVLILGEGLTSRSSTRDLVQHQKQLANLQRQALAAAKVMGVDKVMFESLPDNRFDSVDLLDIVKRVESAKKKARPDIVYTHHGGDLNIDHRVTHQAVVTAFRPVPGEKTGAIYAFEVASSTEWQPSGRGHSFIPNHHVEITRFLKRKLRALACYKLELYSFPHPRSLNAIEAAARLAGAQVGVMAAERFHCVRSIIRDCP